MKHFKKIVTILLASIIVISTFGIYANVFAEESSAEEKIARIGDVEYENLIQALDTVPTDGTQTTITLLKSVKGAPGFKVKAGQNLIIDFAGNSYDASNKTVGSPGTETNGCQLLKGSTVKFKNGTIESTTGAMVIQNYSNLILENMLVNATTSSRNDAYGLSCNCGNVNIVGNTSIKADSSRGQIAFDMCWAPNKNYPEGTQMVVNTSGTVIGTIELDVWGAFSDTNGIKSTLTLKNINHVGNFSIDSRLEEQLHIEGGSFTSDISKYIVDGKEQVTIDDKNIVVEVKPAEEEKIQEATSIVEKALAGEEVAGIDEETLNNVKEALKTANNKTVEVEMVSGAIPTEIEEMPEETKQDALKIVEKLSENEKIAGLYDVSIVVKVDNTIVGKIKELENAVKVKLSISNEMMQIEEGYERTYSVMEVHNGIAKVIAENAKVENEEIEIEVKEFSTFAITYIDIAKANNTIENTSNNAETENNNTTQENTEKEVKNEIASTSERTKKTPKTGDKIAIYMATFIVATIGIVISKKIEK